MRDEVTTDVDREIQRLLEVDPSPEFQARVRIRLSEEPQRFRLGIGWLVSGATALAAVAVLAVFVSSRHEAGPPAAEPVAPVVHRVDVAEPLPPPATQQPVTIAASRPIRGTRAETVLVPAAEREALRRFLRTATENGLAYSVAREAGDDAPLTVPDLTIEPIVIAPIDTTAE